jgi:single-strand DNA-binding protein
MSKGLNSCQFIGNLGADPDCRYTPSGTAVTKISIGVNEEWRDKQSGDKQQRTEWVRATAFGKLAEIMGEHLTKGAKVYVSGKMRTSKYQGQDGVDRYSTEIIADELLMLDSRQGGQQAPAQQQPSGGGAPSPGEQAPDFDDDIPFVTCHSDW